MKKSSLILLGIIVFIGSLFFVSNFAEAVCTDYDGGIDIYTASYCAVGMTNYVDYCTDDWNVAERYCDSDGSLGTSYQTCPTNYKCVYPSNSFAGHCVESCQEWGEICEPVAGLNCCNEFICSGGFCCKGGNTLGWGSICHCDSDCVSGICNLDVGTGDYRCHDCEPAWSCVYSTRQWCDGVGSLSNVDGGLYCNNCENCYDGVKNCGETSIDCGTGCPGGDRGEFCTYIPAPDTCCDEFTCSDNVCCKVGAGFGVLDGNTCYCDSECASGICNEVFGNCGECEPSNTCDYSTRNYCDGLNLWASGSPDGGTYCNNCNHCADGVKNCGETSIDCGFASGCGSARGEQCNPSAGNQCCNNNLRCTTSTEDGICYNSSLSLPAGETCFHNSECETEHCFNGECVSTDFNPTNPGTIGTLEELIEAIINLIFYIAVASAPILIVIAAFYFITAAGDTEKIRRAKNIITYTVIGLAIAFLAKGLYLLIKNLIGVN